MNQELQRKYCSITRETVMVYLTCVFLAKRIARCPNVVQLQNLFCILHLIVEHKLILLIYNHKTTIITGSL